jgi:predicted RNA binding protein YcfA (HicA-like mRNA interferase family)
MDYVGLELCTRTFVMPRKIRELVKDLTKAGWYQTKGGKGDHRKFAHPRVRRKVMLDGRMGDDAKAYQEKDVRNAVKEANQ